MEGLVLETLEEIRLANQRCEVGSKKAQLFQCIDCKDMLSGKDALIKKLTDLSKYVKPNASILYRKIEEDL